MRRAGGRSRAIRTWWALPVAAMMMVSPMAVFDVAYGLAPSNQAASPGSDLLEFSGPTPAPITDGQTISTSAPTHSTLRDWVSYGSSAGGQRSYTIHLVATVALPSVPVKVTTYPIAQWGLPERLPGGADSLPPLQLWGWNVSDRGQNVTSNWTTTLWDQQLSGETTWTNQTIWICGSTSPKVTVTVIPSQKDGTFAPGVGFVMNAPGVPGSIPKNDSAFPSVAAALHPQVVRFSAVGAGVDQAWNRQTNQPRYNFSYFDSLANFTHSVGARILLNFPAGTWGDGNLLPAGMPLNTSISVPGPNGSGFFPSNAAWEAYIQGIVNHTMATGEHVSYWSIGNEFPTDSAALVAAFTNLFNLAEKTIHQELPHALVGSDVMTNVTYEPYFATHARDVGFLSFHYYPSVGMCVVNGIYCPPKGAPFGATDEGLFSHSAYQYLGSMHAPDVGQEVWYEETGKWLPILNAETNLGSVGGSVGTLSIGTDPRTQTLFGASWVTSLLIDSAEANVSDVTYFALSSGWGIPQTLTSPYGGWGYGLTSEAPNDTNTLYAPYFALELWGESIPAHAAGLWANSSAPSVVHTYAALQGTNLSVVLENRVNLPVTIALDVAGGKYTLASVTMLDPASYRMVYEAKIDRTVLESDGVRILSSPNPSSLVLGGYGVAVAKYVLIKSPGPGTASGNLPRPDLSTASALGPLGATPRDRSHDALLEAPRLLISW